MISIDNAVELMIKTYLGLPKRVNGLLISRREFQEIRESFPSLLDALEKHAADKLAGIDLGEIEWYHRLRNELYHQGNGLTVERDKIEIYAQLANSLFQNLFGTDLLTHTGGKTEELGEFLAAWVAFERSIKELASRNSLTGQGPNSVIDVMRFLRGGGFLSAEEIREIDSLRKIRNEVIHGVSNYETTVTPAVVERIKAYAKRFTDD